MSVDSFHINTPRSQISTLQAPHLSHTFHPTGQAVSPPHSGSTHCAIPISGIHTSIFTHRHTIQRAQGSGHLSTFPPVTPKLTPPQLQHISGPPKPQHFTQALRQAFPKIPAYISHTHIFNTTQRPTQFFTGYNPGDRYIPEIKAQKTPQVNAQTTVPTAAIFTTFINPPDQFSTFHTFANSVPHFFQGAIMAIFTEAFGPTHNGLTFGNWQQNVPEWGQLFQHPVIYNPLTV